MSVERCALLDLHGNIFAKHVAAQWLEDGRLGSLIYPCQKLLKHVADPVLFYLCYDSDGTRQQVMSSKSVCKDPESNSVPFLVAGPRV